MDHVRRRNLRLGAANHAGPNAARLLEPAFDYSIIQLQPVVVDGGDTAVQVAVFSFRL